MRSGEDSARQDAGKMLSGVLPVTVEPDTLNAPRLKIPPPWRPDPALLPVTVLLVRASEPPFQMPPPSPEAVLLLIVPPSMVTSPRSANTPPPNPSAGRLEVASTTNWLPLTWLPPLITTGPPRAEAIPPPSCALPTLPSAPTGYIATPALMSP